MACQALRLGWSASPRISTAARPCRSWLIPEGRHVTDSRANDWDDSQDQQPIRGHEMADGLELTFPKLEAMKPVVGCMHPRQI